MAKTILCPLCGKYMFKVDSFTTMNVDRKCSNCKKMVVYHGENEKVTISNVPQRNSASGMRFV